MSQTTVTFISGYTYDPVTGAVTSTTTQERVFDPTIDASAQTYYKNAIDVLKMYQGGDPNLLYTQSFVDTLSMLDAWSKMRYVDGTTQKYVDGTGAVQIEPTGGSSGKPSLISAGGNSHTFATTMSRDMATALQSIQRLLGSFGYKTGDDTTTLKAAWDKMVAAGIAGTPGSTFATTLDAATAAANSAKLTTDTWRSTSIQEMLVTDYVEAGNDLLFDSMSGLKTAITANQMVLNYANTLQDLMNQKEPEKFTLALSYLSSYGSAAIDPTQYSSFEQSSFNVELKNQTQWTGDQIASYVGKNQPLFRGAFKKVDPSISGDDEVFSTQRLKDNLNFIKTKLQTLPGYTEGSLKNLIDGVDGILTDLGTGGMTIQEWVLDYETNKQGDFQRNLTNVITSSQSYNDVARENLNRVMFTFEEFIKSATTIMANLNDIYSKMASKISR